MRAASAAARSSSGRRSPRGRNSSAAATGRAGPESDAGTCQMRPSENRSVSSFACRHRHVGAWVEAYLLLRIGLTQAAAHHEARRPPPRPPSPPSPRAAGRSASRRRTAGRASHRARACRSASKPTSAWARTRQPRRRGGQRLAENVRQFEAPRAHRRIGRNGGLDPRRGRASGSRPSSQAAKSRSDTAAGATYRSVARLCHSSRSLRGCVRCSYRSPASLRHNAAIHPRVQGASSLKCSRSRSRAL